MKTFVLVTILGCFLLVGCGGVGRAKDGAVGSGGKIGSGGVASSGGVGGGPSTIANERQRNLSLIARSNRLSEDASGVGLEVWAMPEAGRSMVISDVR
jgi:hypothetical protein